MLFCDLEKTAGGVESESQVHPACCDVLPEPPDRAEPVSDFGADYSVVIHSS